jgi:PD-(D/E)XK nuclease superfamily
MRRTSLAALRHPLQAFNGQKSWTEIPFGTGEDGGIRDLPWRPVQPIEIPGTGIRIQGHIDRLDLSADKTRARVLDYKTGKLNKEMAEVVINGGGELQRCLYAFAVKTLLASKVEIEAALFYPGAPDGEQALFPLGNLDTVLENLAAAIALARETVVSGIAVPGIDADNRYNDFAFALPASAGYLSRKLPLARERLGQAANIWDEP